MIPLLELVGRLSGSSATQSRYDAAVETEQQDDQRPDVASQVAGKPSAAGIQSDWCRSPAASAAAATSTPAAASRRRQITLQ